MKIKHHIGGNWSSDQVNVFKKFNLKIKEGIDTVQIEESDIYFKLQPYLEKWDVLDMRYPEFTKKELKESLLSAKIGNHSHGYPMPNVNGEYLKLTYDLNDYCENCGIGKKQKESFRLKNVPKQGKKRLFSLEWIFDECFVDKNLYNEIFKPLGIKSREVLSYAKNTPFDNTVQLILEETEEKLNIKDNFTESCHKCGRWKYQPMPQDFYPKYENIIAPIFKSKDWFGTGAEARKRIFITQELREKLIEMKIEKSIWYTPTKPDGSDL